MTREEFFNEVTDLDDLMDFCNDQRLDFCEDIVSFDCIEDYVNECLVDWARDYSWEGLYDRLSEIHNMDQGAYYRYDDYEGFYTEIDYDEFCDLRDEVATYMDENEEWDSEEEEDEDEEPAPPQWQKEYYEPDYEDDVPEEDCTMSDMFSAGVGCIKSISEEAIERARQEDKAFAEFMF